MLNILVATLSEARVLIEHFNLKQILAERIFPIYMNASEDLRIIISGIGKINAAAATSYLYSQTSNQSGICLLNIGIAGGCQYEIGDFLLVNKVVDTSSQLVYYPATQLFPQFAQTSIVTVDRADENYPDNSLIDMEASGFYATAIRMLDREQIQIAKIVSDNNIASKQQITKQVVTDIMAKGLPKLFSIIEQMQFLSEQEQVIYQETELLPKMLQKWHFTSYQCHQLRDKLRRWQVNFIERDPIVECSDKTNGAAVLRWLEQQLQQTKRTW